MAQVTKTGPAAGQVLGDFRLVRELGRGGMGIVYEAEQQSLGRRVAVKVVQTRGPADSELMRRFEREAKAVGRLHHTNIVPIFGVGEFEGSPFYAMQLISGTGLNDIISVLARRQAGEQGSRGEEERLARGLTLRDRAGLIAQAAEGVAHAHDQGVLHRDIKPSNLLLDAQGTVWVTDFGLAKTDDAADLTHTGDLLGTLRYMAPEAFEGKADHRADVYALGLTLYELIALRPAFDGADRAQVMKAVIDASPAPLRRVVPDVPRDLETIVATAIERDPARRYATARALADDLHRFVRDEPILARRVGPVERLARWAKRNRGLAAALAILAVTLVGATIGSLIAAGRFRAIAKVAQESDQTSRLSLYAAEMSLAARVAEEPTGLARLRELVSNWDDPGDDRPDPRGWEWRHFRALSRPERFVQTGRNFNTVAWSPDGARLAVGLDQAIETIDAANGALISRFPLGGIAESLSLSRDGRRLAVGLHGGTVLVLDAANGEEVYRARHGSGGAICCLNPSGRLIAAHSNDRTVRVHDVNAGKIVAELPGAVEGPPGAFGFSPDGTRLATAQLDPSTGRHFVGIWDTADWKLIRSIAGPRDRYTTIGWTDNRRLILAMSTIGVVIWDVETDSQVQQLVGDRHLMAAHDVSAGGKRVVAGDWGRVVWVWETESGKLVGLGRGHSQRIYRVAIAPDGARIAAIGQDSGGSALRVWDVGGRQPVRTFDPPKALKLPGDAGLAWHPNGSQLAASATPLQSSICDLTGKPSVDRRGHQFSWNRQGSRAVAQLEDHVFLYAGDGDSQERTLTLPGQSKSFDWNPKDGRLAIRVGYQLWVCDPSTVEAPSLILGEVHPTGRPPYHPSGGLAWHPNGRTVAFAKPDLGGWSIFIIDPATRTTEFKFPTMPLTVWAAKWSPDGNRIAVAGDDPAILIYDPANGALVQSLGGHTFTVRDLAYSPDGSRLTSAGLDGNVMLWDTKSGRLILTFELGSPVLGVAWSADGTKLAALAETGVVKVWDARE